MNGHIYRKKRFASEKFFSKWSAILWHLFSMSPPKLGQKGKYNGDYILNKSFEACLLPNTPLVNLYRLIGK